MSSVTIWVQVFQIFKFEMWWKHVENCVENFKACWKACWKFQGILKTMSKISRYVENCVKNFKVCWKPCWKFQGVLKAIVTISRCIEMCLFGPGFVASVGMTLQVFLLVFISKHESFVSFWAEKIKTNFKVSNLGTTEGIYIYSPTRNYTIIDREKPKLGGGWYKIEPAKPVNCLFPATFCP